MTYEEFEKTLSGTVPKDGLTPYLAAMWYDAVNNWEKAHELVQDLPDDTASWIHAYLHRKEGDIWNADYWYRRAGRKRPEVSLKEEWTQIVKALL